jgi:hypothetical protein
MKNKVLVILSLLIMSLQLQAEVFTKKNNWIKYKITLDKPQNLEFSFKFNIVDKKRLHGPDLRIDDGEDTYKNGKYLITTIDNTTNKEQKFNVALKAGTYNISLYSQYYIDKPFDFKLTRINGNFEQEPNDKFVEATQMIEKKYFYGTLQRKSRTDKDIYSIIMKEDGELTLEFTYPKGCESKSTEFSLHNGQEKTKNDILNNDLFREKGISFDRTIGLKKGKYFVRIVDHDGRDGCINKKYKIAYLTTSTKHTEFEPNDRDEKASKLNIDGYYHTGRFEAKFNEQDYFYFDVENSQEITIVFKQPNFDKKINVGYTIYLYDFNDGKRGKRLEYFNSKTDQPKTFKNLSLSEGKYLLKVKAGKEDHLRRKMGEKAHKYLNYAIAIIGSKAKDNQKSNNNSSKKNSIF